MSSARIAMALFLAAALLYLATLTAFYSPDGMSFTMLIQAGDVGNPLWFQAEHLFYPTVGAAWAGLWGLLGVRPHLALQVLNALAGAGTVTFLFLGLAALWPRRPAVAVLGAVGLAVSYGHWFHATDVEDQMLANMLVALAFWLLAELLGRAGAGRRLWPLAMGVGLAQAGAVLIHMTAVLWTAPALLALLWKAEGGRTKDEGGRMKDEGFRRWRGLVGYLAALAVATGIPYLLVGILRFGYVTSGDYLDWFLSAPGHGVWGRFSLGNVWMAARTLAEAFVYQQGGVRFGELLRGQLDPANLLALAGFAAVALVLAVLAGYAALALLRPRAPGERRAAAMLSAWVLIYSLFNVYWAPEDVQFWTVVLLPLWGWLSLLVARSWSPVASRQSAVSSQQSAVSSQRSAVSGQHPTILYPASCILLAALFTVNLATAFWPRRDPTNNPGLQAALCLGQHTQPADLIVTPGWDWASSYGPYFAGRRVLSLVDTVLIGTKGDAVAGRRQVDAAIAQTRAAGGRVYVVRLFSLSESDRAWLRETAGLTPEDFAGRPRQPAFECQGEAVWEWTGP